MKITIGAAAQKDRFYKRDNIRNQILNGIKNGENLLLSAPRRIGKSSILLDLVDRPDEEVYAVFVDTEDTRDPDEFFRVLLDAILNTDMIEGFGRFTKGAKDLLTGWSKKIGELKLGLVGLKLNEAEKMSYYHKFVEFLTELNLEGKTILLLIDEFPITVENIAAKHGPEVAVNFLSQNRALRQNHKFNQKIKFVYTGSIGLYTAVKKLGATDRINDLRELIVPPLTRDEAIDITNRLLADKIKTEASPEVMEHLLIKIEWWIPFYFQLIVAATGDLIGYDGSSFTIEAADKAFDMAAENSNIYFQHFKSRLAKVFKDDELAFVQSFMLALKKKPLDRNDTLDMSYAYNVDNGLQDIIEILRHDGYIVEDRGYYKFYSPLLKKWWK